MTSEQQVNLVDKPQSVDLEALEVAIYGRDYAKALPALIDGLAALRRVTFFEGHPTDEATMMRLYNRLAAALTAMFADPAFLLSPLGFHLLARQHEAIDMLMSVSSFEGADHLAPHFSTPPGERDPNKMRFSHEQAANVVKFALAWLTRSGIDFDWQAVARASDAARWLMLPWYASLLSQQVVLHPKAHERREQLLGEWRTFEGADAPDIAIPQMADSFMFCSYALRRHKHEYKRLVVSAYRKLIPLPSRLPPRPERAKPRLLVVLEWSLSLHAMYRVYGPAIAELRERFEVIGLRLLRDRELDEPMLALFDKVVEAGFLNTLESMRETVQRVIELAPDVIYFPSIGMMQHGALLASLRLAPLQIMSYGHPATAGSDAIDFGLSEEFPVDPALHVERVYLMPQGTLRFAKRPEELPEPRVRVDDWSAGRKVIVGVPAMVLKLNVPFLEALHAIKAKAERPIEYRFFPNMNWLPYYHAARELRRWFADARVYPRLFHDGYMRALNECDFVLSTFPFGGTNSLIDAFFLGLPVVAKNGPELHEWWDGHMLRRMGLNRLITETVEDYVDTAAWLINDKTALPFFWGMLSDRRQVEQAFFAESSGPGAGAFGRAMAHLWEERERLTAPGAPRVVHWKESA